MYQYNDEENIIEKSSFKDYPTFVGIGGHKCASTWLSECMREHPEIYMSEPKELGFFSWHYEKGVSWYLEHFKHSSDYKQKGEFTSHYIYEPEAAERIYKVLGKVRIILVVRNPVERALSQIKYGIRHGFITNDYGESISKKDVLEIAEEYPEVLTRSFYFEGLKRFIEQFGIENILIIDQKDCLEQPQLVLSKLWTFLDVNTDVIPSRAGKVVSKGIVPRFQSLEDLRKKIFYWANRNAPGVITWVRKIRVAELYRAINNGKSLDFDEECNSYLNKYFESDWSLTREFIFRPKV